MSLLQGHSYTPVGIPDVSVGHGVAPGMQQLANGRLARYTRFARAKARE